MAYYEVFTLENSSKVQICAKSLFHVHRIVILCFKIKLKKMK